MEKVKAILSENWKGAVFGGIAVVLIMLGMPSDMVLGTLDFVGDSGSLKAQICEE